ncbi:hypothetical protein CAOG_04215 [Capsaspora owczarzaki ATCC 30864]|uniref:SAP domain-containing protein n=1 Tax=Capsaspora owczarzaki (strain ATCC 30864) TaxID=595528 RepID=A0A0D2VRD7_CAPO3|nr:hypothetical protein CAOG_04215 [Capsaspora owczarzaki ATCC 30864]KJE93422.1 hypothetical protein CAOG_004215 [Capsaspora owczarzaki ATCC 30864]|eukprot:XP_004348040.1 hypothetical protein CAOG_04215 [Capsaspora owczarzaki ATCC 30864]
MSSAAAPRTKEQWLDLTVPDLRAALTSRGLSTRGNKPELITRLMDDDAAKCSKQQADAAAAARAAAARAVAVAAPPPPPPTLPSPNTGSDSTASSTSSSSSSAAAPPLTTAPAAQAPAVQHFVPRPAPGTTFTVSSADLEGITVPDEIKALLRVHGKSVELLDRNFSELSAGALYRDLLMSDESPEPRYLTGVGGVGKSSILLMLAVLAMRHNRAFFERLAAAPAPAPAPVNAPAAPPFDGAIFLIYLPQTDAFIQQPPEVAANQLIEKLRIANRRLLNSRMLDEPAFELLKDAFVRQKNSSGHFESALNQWGRINAALVGLESQSHRFRVLVLIDQWNSIIHRKALPVGHEDKLTADHPAQAFYKLSSQFGFSLFVAAVSSSFDLGSENALKDGQSSGRKIPIPPLTAAEAETLRAIWYHRNPPENKPRLKVTAEQMQKLFLKVGGVARILQYYASSRYEANPDTNFAELCEEYYDKRLKRLIESYRPLDTFNDLVQDLSTIFVHGRLSVHLSEVWLKTGMVKKDPAEPEQLIPVSDLARSAAARVFKAAGGGFLHLIYAVATIRWYAIETFVLLHLRYPTNVLRGISPSQTELSLPTTVSETHVLDRSIGAGNVEAYLKTYNNGHPFPANTLFLPGWSTHPVADAVLLTTKPQPNATQPNATQPNATPTLVFFQISESPYNKHGTQIPHLATSVLSKSTTVIDTYRALYGIGDDAAYDTPQIRQGQLPECVKYIYATTDTSTSTTHSVFFMQASHLRWLDATGWDRMTGSPPASSAP